MESDDSRMSEEFDIFETHFLSFLKEKAQLITSMLEGKRILEVGCGTGDLLQFLYSDNLELTGSDYSDVYLEKAKQRHLNVSFFKADLLDKKSWVHLDNYYDSIIASEVIEHIGDDLGALLTMYQILKPNGVLILTVPSFSFLFSLHDKKIGHFRRYSKKSICFVMEEAGFVVEKIRYWNLLGFFGWLINFKILKKDLKNTTKFSIGSILSKFLKLESKMIMPFGLTLVIKARKRSI